MVNLTVTAAQGPMPHRSQSALTSAAALWPAHWPLWTLVPAMAAAFSIGALVAMLTGGEGPAPPVASGAVEDSDETDLPNAWAVPPRAATPTAVAQPETVAVAPDPAPVVEAVQPAAPRRVAADTTTEPPPPAIAAGPSPAESVTRAPPPPSPPPESDAARQPQSDPSPVADRGAPPRPAQTPVRNEAPAAPPPPRAPLPAGLRGTFRDPSGPVAGLTIKLMNGRSEVVLATVTSLEGAYELFPIPPGEYTLQFLRDQDLVYERPALAFAEAQMRTLGVSSPTPVSPEAPAPPTAGR